MDQHSLKKIGVILKWFTFFSAATFLIFFLFIFLLYMGSKLAGPPEIEVPQTTVYYASDGTVIGESSTVGQRYWVKLDEISPYLIDATIAIEDRRFYEHHGFDWIRIAGAILADLKALDKVQGASTISQQYARNLFLTHEKTWLRKLKEAYYTIRLEANLPKEEILEGYLNTIYYGHGVYGIEAASRYYFQKSAAELALEEAAMLAGIPKGPRYFSPFHNFDNAKKRQELILSVMAKEGLISAKEAELAKQTPLEFVGGATLEETFAPYFLDVVRMELKKIGLDERALSLGGLKVYTTLDPALQTLAEETIKKTIDPHSTIQVAFIAMDPETGFIKALVGGRDYNTSYFNRATQAIRQPGSTVKPLLYYAALEKGFTPATTFRSEETTFLYDEGRAKYTPRNFNNKYAEDEITLLQALALSDNVFAVKTHLLLGMETFVEYLQKFGIESEMLAVPSLALGTSGLRPIELARAYSMLANGGKQVESVFIEKVVDRHGRVIYEYDREAKQVLDPDIAFVTPHMMTGIFDQRLNSYATVTGASISDRLTREYAGKSGSTNTDYWMAGFTPDLLSVVWTGYDQGQTISRVTEKQYAKQIWAEFMEKALEGKPYRPFQPTEGVVGVAIDPETGMLATENCPTQRYTYFVKGTEPQTPCSKHAGDEPRLHDDFEKNMKKRPWYRRWLDWFGE